MQLLYDRKSMLLLLAALILTLIRFGPILHLPFDKGHESMLDGRYYAGIQKGWLEEGLLAGGGRPRVTPLPTTPVSGHVYVNHPPLAHYITHLFVAGLGWKEVSFRLVGLAASLVTLWVLLMLVRRFQSEAGAWAFLLAFLSLPTTLLHGMTASYAPLVLCFGALAMNALLHEGKGPGRTAAAALFFFLATWTDWAGLFYFPGILLLSPTRRQTIVLSLALLGGCMLFLAQVIFWEGGVNEAWKALNRAGANALSLDAVQHPAFLTTLGTNLKQILTLPGIILLIMGLAWSLGQFLKKKPTVLDRLNLAFFSCAVIKTAVFPVQAFFHDFWPYPLVACTALGAATAVNLIPPSKRILGFIMLLAFVAHGHGVTQGVLAADHQNRTRALAQQLNRDLGSDYLIVIMDDISPLYFYLDGWCIDGIRDLHVMGSYFGAWRRGDYPQKRFALVAPKDVYRALEESPDWQTPDEDQVRDLGEVIVAWTDR